MFNLCAVIMIWRCLDSTWSLFWKHLSWCEEQSSEYLCVISFPIAKLSVYEEMSLYD